MNKIKSFITALTSAFFSFFGLLAIPILLLVSSNITDYVTGLMASTSRKEKICSYKGIKGIFKKVGMYLLVFIGFIMDVLVDYSIKNLGFSFDFPMIISCVVCVWLVCNEVISILENLIDMEVPIPKFLLPIVKKIKATTEDSFGFTEED